MKRIALTFAFVLVAAQAVAAADAVLGFEGRMFKNDKEETLGYQFLMPSAVAENRAGDDKFPLVIFLHGAGERGTDLSKVLIHGVRTFATDEMRKKHPCFVIAPQCPAEKKWVEVDWSLDSHQMPETVSDSLRLTLDLVESLQKRFPIDSNRIYVTGLSMGGYGTWDLLQRYPDRFAAAAPVCGGGDPAFAKRCAKVPVWAFHGAKDTAVKPERSRAMIAAIEAAGGKPKYIEYPDVGHNSWVNAYGTPELYDWMFAQRKK